MYVFTPDRCCALDMFPMKPVASTKMRITQFEGTHYSCARHSCKGENWIHVKWNMKERLWGEMAPVETLILDTCH